MKPTVTLPDKIQRVIEVDIDPKHWVWVPGTNYFVSSQQDYNGLQWRPTLTKALREKPFAHVTPPHVFLPHYADVCASMRKKNPTVLYDGNGEPLSTAARKDLQERRTTDTWVWQDAYFEQRKNGLYLLTDHQLVQGKVQPQKEERLEKCVNESGVLVDLIFNAQGLPTRKSKQQEYQRGKNISFWSPQENSVVWFYAVADGAGLLCYGGPQGSGAAVGVLLCAEGAAKK